MDLLGADRLTGVDFQPSNSSGLRFNSRDDAVNFARSLAQDGVRRSIEGMPPIAEAYLQNHVEFEFVYRPVGNSNKFKAVLRRDPTRVTWSNPPSAIVQKIDSEHVAGADAYNSLVFIRTCEGENGIETWIPSLANIQCLQEIERHPGGRVCIGV